MNERRREEESLAEAPLRSLQFLFPSRCFSLSTHKSCSECLVALLLTSSPGVPPT